jgi:hypothetical protein
MITTSEAERIDSFPQETRSDLAHPSSGSPPCAEERPPVARVDSDIMRYQKEVAHV